MLFAVAFNSQVLKLPYAALNAPVVGTVNRPPVAFRSPNELMQVRHAGSLFCRILWPFELLQNPSVSPRVEAGLQTLPKETDGLLDSHGASTNRAVHRFPSATF